MPVPIEGHEGPVLTTIEYFIDPSRADEFAAVMRETRSSRLRQGAVFTSGKVTRGILISTGNPLGIRLGPV